MLISFHQTLRDWLQKSPSPQMTESEESLSGQTPCKKSCNTFLVLVFTPGCIKMFSLIQMFWFFLLFRFEVNETIGLLTLVAYRNKGTYGNVSLLFFAQSLEAQQGLDYNASEMVRHRFVHAFKHSKHILTQVKVGLEF